MHILYFRTLVPFMGEQSLSCFTSNIQERLRLFQCELCQKTFVGTLTTNVQIFGKTTIIKYVQQISCIKNIVFPNYFFYRNPKGTYKFLCLFSSNYYCFQKLFSQKLIYKKILFLLILGTGCLKIITAGKQTKKLSMSSGFRKKQKGIGWLTKNVTGKIDRLRNNSVQYSV